MMFRKQPGPVTQRSNRRDLDYHSLEQRRVLTTFFVNSALDDASGVEDGLITFREALIAANTNAAFGDAPAGSADGDAIRFSSAIQGAVIPTTNGEYTISDDVLIQGGNTNVTFDGQGTDRIFNDITNESISIGRLTFQNGSADQGGAISSSAGGTLLAVNSTFINNDADGLGGGAVFHETGSLYLTDSTFDGNTASGASGSGGAVLNLTGSTASRGSTFTSNTATDSGGAIELESGSVYVIDSIVGTLSEGNIAGPGPANPGNGGGVHVRNANAVLLLTESTVEGNVAADEGGGVWNGSGAKMYVRTNSSITGNQAMGNGGGGIFNAGGGVYMTDSTISDNVADGNSGSGGGIFSTDGVINVADSTISSNAAVRAGGGLELETGFAQLSGVSLANNDAGVTIAASLGNGGGIHITADADLVLADDTTVTGNSAASEGGGLWNSASGRMFIRSGTSITNNTAMGNAADQGGGGIFNNGGTVRADFITISDNTADGFSGSGGGIFSTAGAVTLNDSTIDNNVAARAGGGVEVIDGFFRMTASALTNNDAGITLSGTPGNGGGLHVTGTATTVFDSTNVASNSASMQGGGLWNRANAAMYLQNGTTIAQNTTLTNELSLGGGVYNNGYLSALDSLFSMNSSIGNGGGLLNSETGIAELDGTDFTGNGSQARGGGISNDNVLSVNDGAFTTNVATFNGGAIYTESGASTTTSNLTFSGNLPNDQN